MALRQQNQPESGSRTLTQTATPARGAGEDTNNGEPSEPVGVLKLRGGPSRRQKVVWSEETVDNEGMGKKKSKSAFKSRAMLVTWLTSSLLYIP
jgi:protein phosphatase 1 regulatory subunit 11